MQQPPPLINLPGLGNTTLVPPPARRRRWMWIIIIIAILLVILLGSLIVNATRRGPNVTYQYGQATQGNLVIAVNATGPLQSGNYNLVFSGTGGKIDEIDVAVGQKVTKGLVLAQLDKTLLQDTVNQDAVAVGNAQATLNADLASANSSQGASNSSVSAAQTAVSDQQANQTQVQAQGTANVAAAQTALDNAQASLTQVTNTANLAKQQALDTFNATGCSNAPNPGPPLSPPTSLADCQVAQDKYNAAVDQANASIATAQQDVNTKQAALTQAQTKANGDNATAQNQLNTANNQLNAAQSNANVSGSSAQIPVTAAQSQLNTALAQLVQAQHNLDNATLKAPHDGTVTVINGTVGGTPGVPSSGISSGTTTTAGGSTFIQIVDPSVLQVVTNVNEPDIGNLQVGETASFTLNAYGNQQFTGKVSAIPPTGQTTSNVVTYPVTIDVDSSSLKGAHLLPSMTANMTINAVEHKNVLLLPVNAVNIARLASSSNSTSNTPQLITAQAATTALNQARRILNQLEVSNPNLISQGPMPAFVIEKSGQQFVAKPVVLGLTDGTSYEVLQGLTLSDTFLVGIKG